MATVWNDFAAKFKHLYPTLYTSYAIKKNIQEFCMTIPVDWISQNESKREKLKIKTLTFEHKNNCLQKIKKRNIKSRSLLALNAHPANLILSVSQLAARFEVSLSFFPFWFLCISTYVALIYYKVWSSGTQSVRNSFHYFKKV